MVYPEDFSVAKLVLVHRMVNDNTDKISRLHILQSGCSTLITLQCAYDKSIKVYRRDGGYLRLIKLFLKYTNVVFFLNLISYYSIVIEKYLTFAIKRTV